MKKVPTNDPRVTRTLAAIRRATVKHAYTDVDDNLHLETRDHYIIILADPFPEHAGAWIPNPSPRGEDPTHPSPPQEEPTHPSPPRGEARRGENKGLDDFTAIDGVGPVTAQKLHDADLYTYDDLRAQRNVVHAAVGQSTLLKIEAWLQERLC